MVAMVMVAMVIIVIGKRVFFFKKKLFLYLLIYYRVNQTIDLGSVYLFLDCLHDMQHHAERYPASVMLPSSFIKELKEFVNSHFL